MTKSERSIAVRWLLCWLAVASAGVATGRAQIVDVRSGPLVPYGRNGNASADAETRPAENQAAFANVYATVIPGQNSKLPDVATGALSSAYVYPAFDFVFSITSRMFGTARASSFRRPPGRA